MQTAAQKFFLNPQNFSFWQIFSLTLEIFVQHWKIFLMLYALFFLPLDLLMAFFPAGTTINPITGMEMQKMHVLEPVLGFLGILSTFFIFAFIRLLTSNQNISFLNIAAEFRKNAWGKAKTFLIVGLLSIVAIILVGILVGILAALKFEILAALAGIIGAITLIYWSQKIVFSLHFAAFRDVFGMQAIFRSMIITDKKLLKIFSYFFLSTVLLLCALFLFSLASQIVFEILGMNVLALFITSGVSSLVTFLLSIFSALMYVFFEITHQES